MRQSMIVSSREQVTLPATLPELEMYGRKQVATWDQQDLFSATQRRAVFNRVLKCVPKVAKKRG